MRFKFAILIAACGLGSAMAAEPAPPKFDWKPWQSLPVLDGGRQKPLDTLAWETWRLIANKTAWADPETGVRLSGAALYLATVLDWQPGDTAAAAKAHPGTDPRVEYFAAHQPDKWDRAPLIFIDSLELRKLLGMPDTTRYISPLDLSQANLQIPSGKKTSFLAWAESLTRLNPKTLSELERQATELADRLWTYQDHRRGQHLQLIPVAGSEQRQWLSVAQVLQANSDAAPAERLKERWQKVQAAYRAGNADEFNKVSAELIAGLREAGPKLGEYPPQKWIDLEVAYNHWAPFRFAWILAMLAAIGALLSMGSGWRPFYFAAVAASVLSLAAMIVGFAMRIAISGRAPVTDMYESVIYVGLGVTLFALAFEIAYRKQFILLAGSAVSMLALILADTCPAILDPSLRPLQPVLRSNFWLVIHVMTITLSYAAFALALGISDITLGYFLTGSRQRDVIVGLTKFSYHALQVGVVLLAAGIVLGGVWAQYSWGRFWGWDPKEVWALVALLGYIAVLHARFVGWVRELGLAALSVLCFLLVVMAWYGVNFVLGAGLHSYGFGSGVSHGYVALALSIQFLYMFAAVVRGLLEPLEPDAPANVP